MTAHARMSPSSAERWLRCPGSVRMSDGLPDGTSEYANEGSRAHLLSELMLLHVATDAADVVDEAHRRWVADAPDDATRPREDLFPAAMLANVEDYVDRVRLLIAEMRVEDGAEPALYVEERVDIGRWVPGSFGTADVIVVGQRRLAVVDLKYGQGVQVDATRDPDDDEKARDESPLTLNPQATLYALGALRMVEEGGAHEGVQIEAIDIVIDQPRLDHYDRVRVVRDELLSLGHTIGIRASMALSAKAPLNPGSKQCRFCPARATCPARAEQNMRVAREEFGDQPAPQSLTIEQLAELFRHFDDIEAWISDVRAYLLQQAREGATIPGYKLVRGRSTRRWKPTAAGDLDFHPERDALFREALVGITDAERVLGPEVMKLYTNRPPGRPALVPESDPRAAISSHEEAVRDFSS